MSTQSIASHKYCRYCGNSVAEFWQTEDCMRFFYSDDTPICKNCHQSAVQDDTALLAAWKFVVQSCMELGLHATWGDVKVRLRNAQKMKEMSGGHGIVGLAKSQALGSQLTSDITILRGMPLSHAIGVLAHEAGHVFCFEYGIAFQPREVEEGFCNVVACLVIQRLPAYLCPDDRVKALFADQHPVYGLLFKQEWMKVIRYSWSKYLMQVKTLKDKSI